MKGRTPKYIKGKEGKVNVQVRRTTHKKLKELKEKKRLADFDAVISYLLELYEQVIEGK